jgi:hypothetical protein
LLKGKGYLKGKGLLENMGQRESKERDVKELKRKLQKQSFKERL